MKKHPYALFHYKRLVQCCCILSIIVIMLGAYTRLSDAGLGCPDWPGCYGFLVVPDAKDVPVKLGVLAPEKAWKEMIHRYVAGSLGLLILFIFIVSIIGKKNNKFIKLSGALLFLVLIQATLGMLTVTMALQPLIVVAHLLGGFMTLNVSWLLLLNIEYAERTNANHTALKHRGNTYGLSLFTIAFVLSQVLLGGWLAANYAAPYCNELPFCNGLSPNYSWQQFSFSSIWQLPEHSNYEFGVLSAQSRLSIHLFHRFWAVITATIVLLFVMKVFLSFSKQTEKKALSIKKGARWVASFVLIQVLLGGMMVFWHFPIIMALAHNICAALLLMALVRLSHQLKYCSTM